MKYKIIPFEQPAGNFLLTVMPASELIRIAKSNPRKFDAALMDTVGGIQRSPSGGRVREIADYATTVDAAFPTPILLALNSADYSIEDSTIEVRGSGVADIVDGQHRVLGLREASLSEEFVLPVVFILDPTEEQKALIFAVINGKQTKVPASIVYDLFGITKTRSPQKTAHEIARALNGTSGSPLFKRLKMLGKKTPGSLESISQGTFINALLPYISSDPMGDMNKLKKGEPPPVHGKCIFNEYFRTEQDSIILRILMNMFQAARNCWPAEWDNPDRFILTKSAGIYAMMAALPEMVLAGKKTGDLSVEYFQGIFSTAKDHLATIKKGLTSEDFSASGSGGAEIRDIFLKGIGGGADNPS